MIEIIVIVSYLIVALIIGALISYIVRTENEKLKKTIEILEKQNEGQTISQEEDDLLKEVLENDK